MQWMSLDKAEVVARGAQVGGQAGERSIDENVSKTELVIVRISGGRWRADHGSEEIMACAGDLDESARANRLELETRKGIPASHCASGHGCGCCPKRQQQDDQEKAYGADYMSSHLRFTPRKMVPAVGTSVYTTA
jgi:hypothetical protein